MHQSATSKQLIAGGDIVLWSRKHSPHHYCGSFASSIYNLFSTLKYAASLVSRNERDGGQRGGEGSGQGVGLILLTTEKLYSRDCSHKWTQTYESKSGFI